MLITLAATYALVVGVLMTLAARTAADGVHAAADMATIANSIGIPVTILVTLLTFPTSRRR